MSRGLPGWGAVARLMRAALALIVAATPIVVEAQSIVGRPAVTQAVKPGLRLIAPVVSGVLPAGATWTWVGDGLVSSIAGGVGAGPPNAPHRFAAIMGGRVQAAPVPILARSGSTIGRDDASNKAWVNPYAIDAAIAQRPRVFILGSMGANDNLLSTAPGANPASGATTNPFLQDWYDAVGYAYAQWSGYAGSNDVFVVVATIPSAKAGETTIDSGQSQDRRTRVWAAMAAHVATLTTSDPRVVFVPLTGMLPPTDYSIEGPGNQYVHIDERGGYFVGNAVAQAIDTKVESATADTIMDRIVAGSYPLMTAAQGDSDAALAGTGGTVTGPGVSGSLATSKAISNTTGATGITVAQVSTSGGRTKTVVTLAGTTSAAGKIMVQDKSNISVASTPGQPVSTAAIFRASAGFHNLGSEWNNGFGIWGGGATSITNNTYVGTGDTRPLDALIRNNPNVTYSASGPFTGKRSWAVYWRTGTALSGSIEIERPAWWVPSNRTAAAPRYLGDVVNSAGTIYLNNNYRLRPTGTVTNAAGGTVRVEPGAWNLFGLTEADFAARRVYAGGTAGAAGIGTGTLLGTLTGSTWTYTVAAAALAAGTSIYVELDCNNGVGGTVTARSAIAVTVG